MLFRKPEFQTPEKSDFQKLLDSEFAAAKEKNPDASYEQVMKSVASKFPTLYQVHSRRVGGDKYATISTSDDGYFKKVSDLLFTELKKHNPGADYSDAVARSADWYPQLYEKYLGEKIGVIIPQRKVALSDRKKITTTAGTLDRLAFARMALPKLVKDRLAELRAADKGTKYEVALSQISVQFSELYSDYTLSLSA